MPHRVEIIRQTRIFEKLIFKIYEVELRHERYDGTMSAPVRRVHLERGTGAAAVVHDTAADAILLVEQFRHPAHYDDGPGWLLELPAGIIEPGESAEDTVRREISEETGGTIKTLEPVSTFYVSPGGSTERIHLYYATVTGATASSAGLADEGEDIRVVPLPVSQIAARIADGTIQDARTLVGLQWFLLNR